MKRLPNLLALVIVLIAVHPVRARFVISDEFAAAFREKVKQLPEWYSPDEAFNIYADMLIGDTLRELWSVA